VRASVLNPKSLTLQELYGCPSVATNEWQDGLASSVVRRAAAAAAEAAAAGDEGCQEWVVFDGPVDTLWVESLNTGERRVALRAAAARGRLAGGSGHCY
jgi:dynein heavy chain